MNQPPKRTLNPMQWVLIGGALLLLLLFFAFPRGSSGEEVEISLVKPRARTYGKVEADEKAKTKTKGKGKQTA